MRSRLSEELQDVPEGQEARSIIGSCVHCGFCLAACPTYQLSGDELESPRGRIYLVKELLEGARPTALTRRHLDQCLSCRACESACPSGVRYGRLIDIGRELAESRRPRPAAARLYRALLRRALSRNGFAAALWMARMLRPILPSQLARRIPRRVGEGPWPTSSHPRRMVLPSGCVQPGLAPRIDAATARVCDAVGIELERIPAANCCGALPLHLGDRAAALEAARRNIDAWWPRLESGAEGVIINASGCGMMVRDYETLLEGDAGYSARGRSVAARTRDLVEVLPAHAVRLRERLGDAPAQRVAFHPPCTLQHGQRIRGEVERLLSTLGAEVVAFESSSSCCGSAGPYSLLNPRIGAELRDRKLAAIQAARPEVILSANIGCIAHLASASDVPVMHWIEWVDARLAH